MRRSLGVVCILFVLLSACTAPNSTKSNAVPSGLDPLAIGGDPVDMETGLYIRESTDLSLNDTIPIKLTRTYRNADHQSRPFGIGTNHPWDMFIVGDSTTFKWVDLVLADGANMHYDRISPGTDFASAVFEDDTTPTEFFRSRINWNGRGWTVSLTDGSSYRLLGCSSNSRPGQCGVVEYRNRHGDAVQVLRKPNGDIQKIVSPHGKWIDFTQDAGNRIVEARASDNRVVKYEYDLKGRLTVVHRADGQTWRYGYSANDEMTDIAEGSTRIKNIFLHDRCIHQSWHDGEDHENFDFTYHVAPNGQIERAVMVDSGGSREVTFGASGYTTAAHYRFNNGYQIILKYDRDPATNALRSVSVSCGQHPKRQLTEPADPLAAGDSQTDLLILKCRLWYAHDEP